VSSPDSLRDRLAAEADHRCGYCHSTEKITGIKLVLDHLVPKARGGSDDQDNRWPICDP
jgi:5-methylcytosine-specific restriction endonuclease McrA